MGQNYEDHQSQICQGCLEKEMKLLCVTNVSLSCSVPSDTHKPCAWSNLSGWLGLSVSDINNQLRLSVWAHVALVQYALMPGWDKTLAKAGKSCLLGSSQTEVTTVTVFHSKWFVVRVFKRNLSPSCSWHNRFTFLMNFLAARAVLQRVHYCMSDFSSYRDSPLRGSLHNNFRDIVSHSACYVLAFFKARRALASRVSSWYISSVCLWSCASHSPLPQFYC